MGSALELLTVHSEPPSEANQCCQIGPDFPPNSAQSGNAGANPHYQRPVRPRVPGESIRRTLKSLLLIFFFLWCFTFIPCSFSRVPPETIWQTLVKKKTETLKEKNNKLFLNHPHPICRGIISSFLLSTDSFRTEGLFCSLFCLLVNFL